MEENFKRKSVEENLRFGNKNCLQMEALNKRAVVVFSSHRGGEGESASVFLQSSLVFL